MFSELKTALANRGFNHIDGGDTRLGQLINDARQRLDMAYLWPYREQSVTGVAPLAVVDLGTIEAVTDMDLDVQLRPVSYQAALDWFGDLSETGTPQCFYVGTLEQTPVVGVVPASSETTIGVQYWRRPPTLLNDSDTPLAPADYHHLIVDMAAQRAYIDTDNVQTAGALQPFIAEGIQLMVDALLGGQQIAGPQDRMATSDASTDW